MHPEKLPVAMHPEKLPVAGSVGGSFSWCRFYAVKYIAHKCKHIKEYMKKYLCNIQSWGRRINKHYKWRTI